MAVANADDARALAMARGGPAPGSCDSRATRASTRA